MSILRLGLAQMNATVGALEANTEAIRRRLGEARDAGVDVVAFPELAVCGYPPEDLLLKPSFVAANRAAVKSLAAETAGMTAVVGFVDRQLDLFNAAAILHDGEWLATYHKQRLPNYGVFDELRYFKPGRGEVLLCTRGAQVGVSVCEDIWVPGGPVARLARAGADVIVNINASPFERGKWRERQRMLATRASDHGVVLAYVNLVGGQDELVFDGNSVVFGAEGELLAEAPPFEEELLVCDVELERVFRARLHDPRRRHALRGEPLTVERVLADVSAAGDVGSAADAGNSGAAGTVDAPARGRPPLPTPAVLQRDDLADVYAALVLGTRDYVRKNGFEHVVLGLSGGIDSALVAAVAVDALGAANVTGVKLPSRYSSQGSRDDADELARLLGIEILELGIEPIFDAALDVLAPVFDGREPDLTEENLQARARGLLLMGLSNKFGWLLLTTGNKSELAVGYATLYGDMAGGFAVIKDVPKTLVYDLARWRNEQPGGPAIPEGSITKPPSAELRPDQTDQDSLPPYDVLDGILERYVEQDWSVPEIVADGYDEETVRRVFRLVDLSEYKRRQAAPGVKVTGRAFGRDRRLPITSGFRES
jgi:NAD+ synthase (glutamine-hydrolysing)